MKKKTKITFILSLSALEAMLAFFLIAPHFLHHDPYATNLSYSLLPAGQGGYLLGLLDHLYPGCPLTGAEPEG